MSRGRPWNPLRRDDSFFIDAVYVVVDAMTVNEDDVPIARLAVHPWPRFCSAGHLHFSEETLTVFVDFSTLAVFLGQYIPSLTIREGSVFYASRLGFTPTAGEMLSNPAAHFMRPLADVTDAARDMAAGAMLRAIHGDEAASSCDWSE